MRASLLAALAFLAAWRGADLLRRWAGTLHLVDVPNPRSSHSQPTPRGAGLALVLAVAAMSLALGPGGGAGGPTVLLGPLMIAGIGLADDVRSLSSGLRLAVQVLAAAFVVGADHLAAPPPQDWHAGLVALSAVVALVWLVGMTNAYNFMDGIDGIAGAQGVVAGLGWAVLGRMTDEPVLGALGLLIASACAGFLLLNWPPARIFMGDVGSGFLGFTFAMMTLLGARRDPVLAVCGLLLVWPFVADTAFTLARRLARGENVFRAHRSHVYQRLVLAGLGHSQVTLVYTGLAVVGFAGSVTVAAGVAWAPVFVLTLIGSSMTAVYLGLRRLEASRPQAEVNANGDS